MKLKTTRVSDYLGLTSAAPTGLLHETDMGSEAIVGILDSGIWPDSKSFNDNGLGPIPARWKGKCVSAEAFNASSCNRKLIGAMYYSKGLESKYNGSFNAAEKGEVMSPLDKIGHGTHCASTAVGSFVPDANVLGLAQGTARGSAPRARIASYKVCWNNEECFTPDIVKAIDHAIRDGVDVLSLSLGSEVPVDFEVDRDDFAIAAFHAVMKGIPVVCAGGNDGPEKETISNVAPWLITVAATTMDREYFTPITLGNNITLLVRIWLLVPQETVTVHLSFNSSFSVGSHSQGQEGLYIGEEVGFTDLLFYDDVTREDMEAGKATGKILLFFQRANFEDDFAAYAKSKGAVGVIIATQPTDSIDASTVDIAIAYVDNELGMDILLYIQTTK